MDKDMQDKLFSKIQECLKPNPVAIIWGSGATIPFGMPSMDDLKKELKIKQAGNLEDILSKNTDPNKKKKFEEDIYKAINKKDAEFRNRLIQGNTDEIRPTAELFNYLYRPHPQLLNVITTNYDCVLEYIFSHYGFPYSDGFSGREFSSFDSENFRLRKYINLYKVHGSLRWYNERYSYCNQMMDGIFPSYDKFQRAMQDPYRTLITDTDKVIQKSNCFIVIGFGFNDDHLTPKIDVAIRQRAKMVVITKEATKSLNGKLKLAQNYVLIESGDRPGTTKFRFKENGQEITTFLDGNYWCIEEFNKILF